MEEIRIYHTILNSLGVMPFILLKKRVKVRIKWQNEESSPAFCIFNGENGEYLKKNVYLCLR